MADAPSVLQTLGFDAGRNVADGKAETNWNNKKFKEEYDTARSKLVDQSFEPKMYPDPLLPRQVDYSRFQPRGMTDEISTKLDEIIAEAKMSRRNSQGTT